MQGNTLLHQLGVDEHVLRVVVCRNLEMSKTFSTDGKVKGFGKRFLAITFFFFAITNYKSYDMRQRFFM